MHCITESEMGSGWMMQVQEFVGVFLFFYVYQLRLYSLRSFGHGVGGMFT